MIPERSDVAKSAKSVFFIPENDLDIYIEDKGMGYEKIFTEILSRLFEGRYRVAKVFPLGSRQTVISHFNGEAQKNSKRPYLYIVDGDLFLLCGDPISNQRGLYRLPFYCIENILIDPDALHVLLNEEDPVKLKEQLKREFDYESWMAHNEPLLVELFVEYAASFKLNPSQQTVAYGVNKLVSCSTGHLDALKINERIEMLRAKSIQASGQEEYENIRADISIIINNIFEGRGKFISGKDYLLPLLKTRFRWLVKTAITDINLKLRLAMRCNLQSIRDAENSIAFFER